MIYRWRSDPCRRGGTTGNCLFSAGSNQSNHQLKHRRKRKQKQKQKQKQKKGAIDVVSHEENGFNVFILFVSLSYCFVYVQSEWIHSFHSWPVTTLKNVSSVTFCISFTLSLFHSFTLSLFPFFPLSLSLLLFFLSQIQSLQCANKIRDFITHQLSREEYQFKPTFKEKSINILRERKIVPFL